MSVYKQALVSVTEKKYASRGREDIRLITLQNEEICITISNLGGSLVSIFTPDRDGIVKNIVAGFADPDDYRLNPHYFGCVVGRFANRISEGRFILDGTKYTLSQNDGANHLHGGVEGFNKKLWSIGSYIREGERAGVVLEYRSRDGEEGYPGNLHVKLRYALNEKNQLSIAYMARTDKATPVSLTNHSYFNLTGFETPQVCDHVLQINARQYTPKTINNTPAGHFAAVKDTALDFLLPKKIGTDINAFPADKGFDQNFVLNNTPGQLTEAASLLEPGTGRKLAVYTDRPAMQLYTANLWDGSIIGSQGLPYEQHGAIALETQAFPDGPNQPAFPSAILHPGQLFQSETIYAFSVQE